MGRQAGRRFRLRRLSGPRWHGGLETPAPPIHVNPFSSWLDSSGSRQVRGLPAGTAGRKSGRARKSPAVAIEVANEMPRARGGFFALGENMSRSSSFLNGTLVLALAASAAVAGVVGVRSIAGNGASLVAGTSGAAGGTGPAASGAERSSDTYIVVYREQPLAAYEGGVRGLAAPARLAARSGALRARLDVRSREARAYVDYLAAAQRRHESRIAGAVGRPLEPRRRMRHALNAGVFEMTRTDAERVRKLPEVMLVEAYREYEQDTDVGPALIGAPGLWNGTPSQYKGEGIVFGIIDSGINFGSPSFAATDVDGYTHANPLGDGTYLGTCAAGGVDAGRCNSKLIGGYDFVCGAPGNSCNVAGRREEPGFGDTNSHGSHTASTAAGNFRTVDYRGNDLRISGVAPRANIVAYDVCYTELSTGRGLCPNVSSAAAVDQAVADGIIDVINFSIGGGDQPWSDAVSLAFLNAADAGIYVATSAGNSGPGPNTMGHLEPWTASTAAATHGREDYALVLQVTGPAPVPEPLSTVLLTEGTLGQPFDATIPAGTPVKVSATLDGGSDGCTAFAAGTFQDAVAVVRRGTCSFSIKVNNAAAAGAVAVIIANNAAGTIIPQVPDTTVPAFSVLQADGDALRDFANANGNATVGTIPYPAVRIDNTPDVLADFSSRGPAGSFSLVKPDVTAPGVNVLAVVSGTTITGSENAIGMLSGTSMASPHHAGAAGLLRQAHPDWTVAEIKSAIQMTAVQGVLKEDGTTAADAFAMGAGRVQVDVAAKAGLVLDETKANYLAADPAQGGDPATLNLASLANGNCYKRCEFYRTFRNPTDAAINFVTKLEGLPGRATPESFRVPAGATRTLHIVVDTIAQPADGSWRFGKVVLTPSTGSSPTLRLPVAVSILPPAIQFTPGSLAVTVASGKSTTADLRIDNVGGSPLDYTVDASGTGARVLLNVARGAVNSGYRSTAYTDPATSGLAGQFAAEDFVVGQQTRLTTLFTEGFTSTNGELPAVATSITWSVFADAGGQPAGDPLTSPGTAVWSYTAAPTAAGVSTTGRNIGLDLLAAGQEVDLAPGRYWLVMSVRTSFANRWVWFASNGGAAPFMVRSVSASGEASAWEAVTDYAGLSLRMTGLVPCGAPWMGAPRIGASGVVAPGTGKTLRIPFSAQGLAAGQYAGNLCVASNDPDLPRAAAPVTLTVSP